MTQSSKEGLDNFALSCGSIVEPVGKRIHLSALLICLLALKVRGRFLLTNQICV